VLETSPFIEKLIELKRVSKVVKGGKRLKLYACVVVGDGTGNVGIGHAKSSEVAPAIRKATESAKKTMMSVDVTEGTILYATIGKFCASKVVLKPALTGTGINGLKSIRSVAEVAEMRNKPVEYFARKKKYEKAESDTEEKSDRQAEEA
jgi:small subunit ribosomal protein S5